MIFCVVMRFGQKSDRISNQKQLKTRDKITKLSLKLYFVIFISNYRDIFLKSYVFIVSLLVFDIVDDLALGPL
jgi:hypothetical protein